MDYGGYVVLTRYKLFFRSGKETLNSDALSQLDTYYEISHVRCQGSKLLIIAACGWFLSQFCSISIRGLHRFLSLQVQNNAFIHA